MRLPLSLSVANRELLHGSQRTGRDRFPEQASELKMQSMGEGRLLKKSNEYCGEMHFPDRCLHRETCC